MGEELRSPADEDLRGLLTLGSLTGSDLATGLLDDRTKIENSL